MTAERKYHVQHSTAAMVSLHMEKCQLGCDLKDKQELTKQRKGLAGKSRLQRGRRSMVCWETENKFVAPNGDHWVLCLPPLPLFLPFKNKLHLFTYVYVDVCVCVGGYMPRCICECQRTCENWLSPFTMRILGTEPRSSGSETGDLPVEMPCCPFTIFLLCLWSHCPIQRLLGSQNMSGLGTWGPGYLHGQRHQWGRLPAIDLSVCNL